MNSQSSIRLCGMAILAIAIIGCRGGIEEVYRESKIIMGTVVEVAVAHRSRELAREAIQEAFGEFQRIDDLMSTNKPGSAISKLNQAGMSVNVPVGEEVFQLLRAAEAISAASDGAFDVTIWPLTKLWGFDLGGRVPTSELIAKNASLVGYKKLKFGNSGNSVGFGVDGMGVDLGAIAKGWAVDRAMEKIKARGIRNAIIDAGGDVRLIGARPGKDFWRIGVQHPRDPGALLLKFDVRDTAIVTSGDYERYFIAAGVRYHHILDPATGQPARECQSVTVLAPTATEADACATAAFVLGPRRGIAFLRARPGVRGVIVGAAGDVSWTDEALELMASR